MNSVTIQPDDRAVPDVVIYGPTKTGKGGQYFASLVLSTGISVYLPGFDGECAAYARRLAGILLSSADSMDARVAEMAAASERNDG